MTLRVADRWFQSRSMGDGITWLWEPHVVPFTRCNIWHIRGRDRDLIIDTGFGIGSLRQEMRHLLDKPVTAIATHTHFDHIGGHHEFADCRVHKNEVALFTTERKSVCLTAEGLMGADGVNLLRQAGYEIADGPIITAVPHDGFDLTNCPAHPARASALLEEGDVFDIGDRHFEVLHLPGHSPGSIGLWEAATGTLFSGDAIYDGPLVDQFEDADIPTYRRTMERLRELPVRVVHGGHEPSFGRERMIEIIDRYLASRA